MNRFFFTILAVSCAGLGWPLGRIVQADDKSVAIHLMDCRIKPADQVTLSSNQSGTITSVPQEGDVVAEGQRIILLDDELAQASLAVADKQAKNEVDIRHAEAACRVARLEYEQAMELNNNLKGSLPLTEVRRRKLEFDRSLLQIEQSQHLQAVAVLKRHEAAAQLRTFSVAAPFTGIVSRVLKRRGEAARQGEPVLELVNTLRVRVEGFVAVNDRRNIQPGAKVNVQSETDKGEELSIVASGKIVFVDTVAQPVTRRFRVWADVDNADGALIAGLTTRMKIVPDTSLATSTTNR